MNAFAFGERGARRTALGSASPPPRRAAVLLAAARARPMMREASLRARVGFVLFAQARASLRRACACPARGRRGPPLAPRLRTCAWALRALFAARLQYESSRRVWPSGMDGDGRLHIITAAMDFESAWHERLDHSAHCTLRDRSGVCLVWIAFCAVGAGVVRGGCFVVSFRWGGDHVPQKTANFGK